MVPPPRSSSASNLTAEVYYWDRVAAAAPTQDLAGTASVPPAVAAVANGTVAPVLRADEGGGAEIPVAPRIRALGTGITAAEEVELTKAAPVRITAKTRTAFLWEEEEEEEE